MRIQSYIAGIRHVAGAYRIVRNLRAPQQLTLERVVDNPHDPNAIAIVWQNIKIGWVPMGLTAKLAPYVEQGRVTCLVAEKGPRGSIDFEYIAPGEPGFEP